jgi:5-methylcytosine-specific restriction endonuclease McrA
VNPAPPDDWYPSVLEAAIQAYCSDGWASGAAALEPIARMRWTERVARAPVVVERAVDAAATKTGTRRFTPARAGATFRRDHFTCRYCGACVVPVALMSLLSDLYPEQIPFAHTYKDVHPMYWTRGAEADHIEPGSRGGDWEALANHATACVRCNTAKSDNRLADIGWVLLDSSSSEWDGLTHWYRPLWERAGAPNPRYHRRWFQALSADS